MPPSAASPKAMATASTRVDFPLPFSPTSNVTPAGTSSPSRSSCATAGMDAGQVSSFVGAESAGTTRRSGRRSLTRSPAPMGERLPPVGWLRRGQDLSASSSASCAASSASARSSGTSPIRVRRSSRSSTSRAPSWVTPQTQLRAGHRDARRPPARGDARATGRCVPSAFARTSGASAPYRRTSRAGASTDAELRRAVPRPTSGRSCGAAGRRRSSPRSAHRRVDGVLGHLAVGRELAADHRDDAGVRGEHGVLAGQVGRSSPRRRAADGARSRCRATSARVSGYGEGAC